MSQNALAVQQEAAVVPVSQVAISLGTLQAASARALVEGARDMAQALADVIERQRLAVGIQGRKYVKVEGWTTLAVMLGVVAREVSTCEQDGIYTATVELVRMHDGACISRASAECGSDDELDRYGKPIWANRPRYARRSMAQTRATGKACRLAFSWIMALAGYEPTPAEEMPDERQDERPEPEHSTGKLAAHDRLITDNQRKLLEAKINEHQLNREGVKTWAFRRFDIAQFRALTRAQFDELLAQLPKMAAIKAKREAEDGAKTEREAIPSELKPASEEASKKAAELKERAKAIRQCAHRADSGQTYHREMQQAEDLERKAYKLLAG